MSGWGYAALKRRSSTVVLAVVASHAVFHFLSYISASELAGYFRAVPTGPLGRWLRRGLLMDGVLAPDNLPPDNLPLDNLPLDNPRLDSLRRCWRGGLGEGRVGARLRGIFRGA